MVQQATYIAAAVIGTYKVLAGDFTVGSIITISILPSRTRAPLTQLAGTLARRPQRQSGIERAGCDYGRETGTKNVKVQARQELDLTEAMYEKGVAPLIEVTVTVDLSHLNARLRHPEIRPGMQATVELHTGEKAVL